MVCGDRRLTYRELDDRADRLAHHLAALGVGPGALVGVLLERSPDLIVALVGILKAGGAYLPLDPEAPPQRLAFLLEDGGARLVLSQASLRDRLAASGVQSLCIDDVADLGNGGGPAIRRPSPGAEGLAYVMYTSGSTGVPKGVEVPHRALVNLLDSMRDKIGLDADDAVLAVTNVTFDIAMAELFLPLIVGCARGAGRAAAPPPTASSSSSGLRRPGSRTYRRRRRHGGCCWLPAGGAGRG